jgi:hypothetical protein
MVIRINRIGFLMMTTLSNPRLKRRKNISEVLAIAAIILLTLDNQHIHIAGWIWTLASN